MSDIAGTTRDWLSAKVRLKRITVEFFDTAGLDETLGGKNAVDAESQKQAEELIKNCDLVLYVLDSRLRGNDEPRQSVGGANQIVVYNKCDLAKNLLVDGLKISAKTGSGVKELVGEIQQRLPVLFVLRVTALPPVYALVVACAQPVEDGLRGSIGQLVVLFNRVAVEDVGG